MFSTLLVSVLALQLKSQEAKPALKPPAPITRPQPNKVMAMVDGQSILGGDVEKYLWDWKSDEIVQTLINFKLVEVAAKKLHVTVTPEEVQTQVGQALQQAQRARPGGGNPWDFLMQQGYPPSRVEMTLKNMLLLNKITALGFNPNDFVDISMILVKPKSNSAEDEAAAMKSAQGYYDQIQKGDPWSKVLAASTTDPHAVQEDGRLGLRALSLFPPAASAELRKLKPGQVTHPVTTQVGIQIFKLNGFGSTANPTDLQQLKDQYIQQHEKDVLAKLRQDAKIVTVH